MKPLNRDLLVLSKNLSTDQRELELEVEKLHKILFEAESLQNFCVVTEIIDLNIYKIITNPVKIERIIRQRKLKPFQFLNNKN